MATITVNAPQDMRSLALVDTTASGIKAIDNAERLYSDIPRTLEKANAHLAMVQKQHVGCWCGREEAAHSSADVTVYLQIPLTMYSQYAHVWIAYTTEKSLYSADVTGTIELLTGAVSLGSWDIQDADSFLLPDLTQIIDTIEVGTGDNTDLGVVEVHCVVNNTSAGGAGTRSIWLYGLLVTPQPMYSGPVSNV